MNRFAALKRRVVPARRHLSRLIALLQMLVVLVLPAQAARLVFQPDMRDGLRQADQHFQTGRYYAALRGYTALQSEYDNAELTLRVGMVRTVRGEYDLAERALWSALGPDLPKEAHELRLLYLGYVLDRRDKLGRATELWAMLPENARLSEYRHLLQAEQALRRSDYAVAEIHYRAARSPALPSDWHAFVDYRLALLRAASDPEAVRNALERQHTAAPRILPETAQTPPFLAPLLPDKNVDTAELLAVLQTDATTRPQLLGQLYLERNLFALAEAHFAQVEPDSPNARAAAAYAAYTRWRAGDTGAGQSRLEELIAAHPDDSRARTLLALIYIAQEDTVAARDQIDTITTLAPADPDTHLAWANWYAAQRDYVKAGDEYRRALSQATPEQRGRYALLTARFHLSTTYELCLSGLPAAEIATRERPEDATAWTVLAASRYYCGETPGAVEAARTALRYNPAADAAFYLGSALADMGERAAARNALVRAADLAPASVWRERAEFRLAQLP
jgi:tetratricopeptide (TPR) repeat protein